MTSSTKFTFDFLKIAEKFWFLIFALVISSDESQSKAGFNLQSLEENNTGYRAENIEFFPQMKTSRKVHICLHWFFIPSWLCTAMQSNASSLPIIYL